MIQIINNTKTKSETITQTSIDSSTQKSSTSMFDAMLLNIQDQNETTTTNTKLTSDNTLKLEIQKLNSELNPLKQETNIEKPANKEVKNVTKITEIESLQNEEKTIGTKELITKNHKPNTQEVVNTHKKLTNNNETSDNPVINKLINKYNIEENVDTQQKLTTNNETSTQSKNKPIDIEHKADSSNISKETTSKDIQNIPNLEKETSTPTDALVKKIEQSSIKENISLTTINEPNKLTDNNDINTIQTNTTKENIKQPISQEVTSSKELIAKSIIARPTSTDKLKFIKNNKDTIVENSSVESIKKVSDNLNLNVSKVALVNTKTIEAKANTNTFMESEIIKDEKVSMIQTNSNSVEQLREKVFDSKSKMQSFLSTVAQKIVENYKPPLTALKISLNPKELGSIEVVVKSAKNSLNISFNSSPVTMDILTQNQADLRASLTKQFNDEQAFNFNFSSNQQHTNKQSFFEETILDEGEIISEETINNTIVEDTIYI